MEKLITICVFTAVFITIISAQCNKERATTDFRKSVYQFTLDLIRRINQQTDSHFVASTLSPWSILSAISLGASNTTAQEIKDVLQLHPETCYNRIYLELAKQLIDGSSSWLIAQSSTIYFNSSLNIEQSFIDNVVKISTFDGMIISFMETNKTTNIINEHARGINPGATDDIVTPNDLKGVLMLIMEAFNCKGAWKLPFPHEDTATDAFYNDEDQKIGDVSMMYLYATYNVTSYAKIDAQVLELPYAANHSRYSMLIFLPNTKFAITLNLLDKINLNTIFDLYKRNGPSEFAVQIPRFKILSQRHNLKEHLIGMGVKSIFEQESADLSGISDNNKLFLSNFLQRAEIEVIEDGLKEGFATATMFESRQRKQFVANKPFLFMIVDRILQVPIYTGAYSKPSLYIRNDE